MGKQILVSRQSINDSLNIRMIRGTAHDIYVIYQLGRYQFLRLSYTKTNGAIVAYLLADRNKDKARADNIMLMYNVKF